MKSTSAATSYNRISFKLKKLACGQFVGHVGFRKDNAFEPLVDRDAFYTAQGIIRAARPSATAKRKLIERLRGPVSPSWLSCPAW